MGHLWVVISHNEFRFISVILFLLCEWIYTLLSACSHHNLKFQQDIWYVVYMWRENNAFIALQQTVSITAIAIWWNILIRFIAHLHGHKELSNMRRKSASENLMTLWVTGKLGSCKHHQKLNYFFFFFFFDLYAYTHLMRHAIFT